MPVVPAARGVARAGRARKRAAFRDEQYWARPGGPALAIHWPKLLIVGLAPAAHGGNRTGRVFTGDRSGDWLFGALHRAGYANQPTSQSPDDGLALTGAYISAVCALRTAANKALRPPSATTACPICVRELTLARACRVIVCLGKFAYDGVARATGLKTTASLRPRRRGRAARWAAAGVFVPSESAKHLHP